MDTPRADILDHALRTAPFEGWTDRTVRQAVEAAGLPDGAGELYVPGGALELILFWNERTVAHVEAEIARRGLGGHGANLRIRDRVREGVLIALEAIGPHEVAMRRAISRLALPDAAGQAPKQVWAMADAIWHGIGDTSTDINHYTKRTILAGVLSASVVAWLNDASDDKHKAVAFLDRRIDGVMQFEKVKARAKGMAETLTRGLPNPAEILGTLRYGRPGFGRASTLRRRRRSR